MQKTILSLCDFTGNWANPYKDAGYNVILVDLKHGHDVRLWPSDTHQGAGRNPIQFKDILSVGPVHGVLAAPPCTVFSGSGACWKRTDLDMLGGLSIVDACIRIAHAVKPKFWVLENPVGKLRKWLGNPIMSFHPHFYGDKSVICECVGVKKAGGFCEPCCLKRGAYKKNTLLWGSFNTQLIKTPVNPVIPSPLHQNYGGKSEATKTARSATPEGFAKAFFLANQ